MSSSMSDSGSSSSDDDECFTSSFLLEKLQKYDTLYKHAITIYK